MFDLHEEKQTWRGGARACLLGLDRTACLKIISLSQTPLLGKAGAAAWLEGGSGWEGMVKRWAGAERGRRRQGKTGSLQASKKKNREKLSYICHMSPMALEGRLRLGRLEFSPSALPPCIYVSLSECIMLSPIYKRAGMRIGK